MKKKREETRAGHGLWPHQVISLLFLVTDTREGATGNALGTLGTSDRRHETRLTEFGEVGVVE